jgi:single-strand DNA-binding protein
MNVFTCTGNLGGNAEQRVTPQGDAICQFSVAFTSGYGDKKKTTWLRCSLWGKRGESLAPYLVKGAQVCVSGEISLHTWQKDDAEKTSLEMRVNDVTLVGGKPELTGHSGSARAENANRGPDTTPALDAWEEDSIPF